MGARCRNAQDADADEVAAGPQALRRPEVFGLPPGRGARQQAVFPLDGVGQRLTAAELRRWFTHTAEMEARLSKQPAIRMSSRKYKLSDPELTRSSRI